MAAHQHHQARQIAALDMAGHHTAKTIKPGFRHPTVTSHCIASFFLTNLPPLLRVQPFQRPPAYTGTHRRTTSVARRVGGRVGLMPTL
jgi:hypothetical protein